MQLILRTLKKHKIMFSQPQLGPKNTSQDALDERHCRFVDETVLVSPVDTLASSANPIQFYPQSSGYHDYKDTSYPTKS